MKCPFCNTKIPENDNICPFCGTVLSQTGEVIGQVKYSKLGIISLLFGILGILTNCIIFIGLGFGVLAVILGVVALKDIDKSNRLLKGKKFAKSGIVTGAFAIAVWIILTIIQMVYLFYYLYQTRR